MKVFIIVFTLFLSFSSSAHIEMATKISSQDNTEVCDRNKKKKRRRKKCFNSRRKWGKKYYMH